MVRITAFLRPHVLEPVKSALTDLGILGLSVSDVRGCGNSVERSPDSTIVALPIRSKIVAVVPDALVEPCIAAIIAHARTGEAGDGKIFLEPVVDAIRIRTLDRGEASVGN